VAAAVFKTVDKLLWFVVGSIPSLSAITTFPFFYEGLSVTTSVGSASFIYQETLF
jgi:hypothetical protein